MLMAEPRPPKVATAPPPSVPHPLCHHCTAGDSCTLQHMVPPLLLLLLQPTGSVIALLLHCSPWCCCYWPGTGTSTATAAALVLLLLPTHYHKLSQQASPTESSMAAWPTGWIGLAAFPPMYPGTQAIEASTPAPRHPGHQGLRPCTQAPRPSRPPPLHPRVHPHPTRVGVRGDGPQVGVLGRL